MKSVPGHVVIVVLLPLALLGIPQAAQATSLLRASSRACIFPPDFCDFAPSATGAGASSSILRTYGGGSSEFLMQSEAAVTVGGYDHFSAIATTSAAAATANRISYPLGTSAQATAFYQDVVTVTGGVGSGFLRQVWQLTGSTDLGFSASPGVPVENHVKLDFICFAQIAGTLNFLPCADPSYLWTASAGIDQTVVVDVPIVFGVGIQYEVTVALLASTFFNLAGAGAQAFQGFAEGLFGSTGTLVSVQVLNSGLGLVAGSSITSESGFRYDLVGVPEPAVVALVLGPAALLAYGRRRRAAQSKR